ncbi:MAG: ABC transporter ATP-binding protein [Acidobacteriota bacterium]
MPEPALRISAAHKSYGNVEALAGLSMSLDEGEWVGLLGPNGAGKSTLMRVIAGLLRLDKGSLELFGHTVDGAGSDRRADIVGFVPQEIALYPLLTCEQNLRAFGRLHGLRRDELDQRVAWALEWTGLAGRSGDRVGTLSGGMQRRLNIACGVLHHPRLVLLDEPSVGVDPQGRQRIWEMLAELRQRGATLIHSSHELDQIEALCDRMLIVDHGRIIAAGTVDELITGALGERSVLHLECDGPTAEVPMSNGFQASGSTVRGPLHDVAAELPALLDEVNRSGLSVRRLHVERPSLEAVFTRLTGRELRE